MFVSVCSETAGLVVNCYVMNKVRDVMCLSVQKLLDLWWTATWWIKYVLFVSVCSETAGLVVNCYVMNKVRAVCVCLFRNCWSWIICTLSWPSSRRCRVPPSSDCQGLGWWVLSACLFSCVSACIYLPVCLSVQSTQCLSAYILVCQTTCHSVCLPVCLPTCLSAYYLSA